MKNLIVAAAMLAGATLAGGQTFPVPVEPASLPAPFPVEPVSLPGPAMFDPASLPTLPGPLSVRDLPVTRLPSRDPFEGTIVMTYVAGLRAAPEERPSAMRALERSARLGWSDGPSTRKEQAAVEAGTHLSLRVHRPKKVRPAPRPYEREYEQEFWLDR